MTGLLAYRRRLPHYQNEHRTYFVTFVTYNRWTLPPEARDVVLQHACSSRTYFLHAAVVMPDHVHLLLTPDDCALHEITRVLKGRSAYDVNRLLRRRGSVWQHESFDHQLRNDESTRQKAEYIVQNPVRRGLAAKVEDYPWLYLSAM